MIIEEKDERVSLKVTGKEREVVVVQLVFDCILNDVFQLQQTKHFRFQLQLPICGAHIFKVLRLCVMWMLLHTCCNAICGIFIVIFLTCPGCASMPYLWCIMWDTCDA